MPDNKIDDMKVSFYLAQYFLRLFSVVFIKQKHILSDSYFNYERKLYEVYYDCIWMSDELF